VVSTLFYDGGRGGQSLDFAALRNEMPGLRRPGKLRRISLRRSGRARSIIHKLTNYVRSHPLPKGGLGEFFANALNKNNPQPLRWENTAPPAFGLVEAFLLSGRGLLVLQAPPSKGRNHPPVLASAAVSVAAARSAWTSATRSPTCSPASAANSLMASVSTR
jgi:hypothetical protein